jgi:hypothetical protein
MKNLKQHRKHQTGATKKVNEAKQKIKEIATF